MKQSLLILLLFLPLRLLAPDNVTAPVLYSEPVDPYERLIIAIVAVESKGNNLAYNVKEDAAGPFQIRLVRLNDYNLRTGGHYTPADRFDYEISERIFRYYASQYRPDDILGVCRDWNGASKRNLYYKRIMAIYESK